MDIEIEVEELLKKKGVAPPRMTEGQFFEEFARRLHQEIPRIMEDGVRQVSHQVSDDIMKRVGRSVPCRYASDKKEKHCSKPPDCYSCLAYKPIPRWQQWLREPLHLEILFLVFATLSFFSAIIFPRISPGVLGFWFGIVVVSRLHNYKVYKMLQELKGRRQAQK